MSENSRFRHELKYVVDLKEAREFIKDISPYCDYDPHVGSTRSYEIASTYYDTRSFQFFIDREESVGYRRKIRLRSYNTDGNCEALFIEIKEKHKQFVAKKRINLRSKDVLSCGIPHDRLSLDVIANEMDDSAEAREILYLHKRLKLFPVIIIRYVREPLIPKFEDDMRITLDTRITAGGQFLHKYDPDTEKLIIDAGQGVLEVKSNRSIPLWLSSVLKRYAFVQTRYSKYCLGVQKCFSASRPWVPAEESISAETVIETPTAGEKKVANLG